MTKILKYILLFFIAIYFASCSIFNHQIKSEKTPKQEKNELTFTYSFYEGNKQEMLGNYNQAIAYFAKCIDLNKKSAASNYEIAKIYYILKEYDKSLIFAKDAVKLNQKNYWYSYLLASIYEEIGDFKKTEEILKKLAEINPDNLDVKIELAQIYLNNNKINDALEIYDDIEKNYGVSDEISMQKQKIYLFKGKTQKADEELKKLIKAYPNEIKYRGLLAESYISEKRYNEAAKIYKQLTKIDSTNGLVQFSLSEYYEITGKNDSAFFYLKKAMATHDINPQIKIRKMYNYIRRATKNDSINKKTQELFNIILKTKPVDINMQSLYADYLIQQKKYTEARNQIDTIVKTKKNDKLVWEQLIYLDNEIKDFKQMKEHSNEAMELFPNYANFYYLNGLANFFLKDNINAVKSIKKALPLIIDDKEQKVQALTYLGDAYYRLKMYNKSDSIFDEALKIDKTNNYILNNYSYYLSLRGEKLNKAQEMSKKCVDKNPNNYTYIDTYAWVLYKQKKYKQAVAELKKAIDLGGDKSAVIIEHYADALYKTGEKQKAVELWKKAKQTGKASKFLDKKILTKTLIEE